MQQNSWDRDALDQLRDRPKPGLLNNFQEQTRLRRMVLSRTRAHKSTAVFDTSRERFGSVMQKNQAGGDEQCCATSVFVLHLLWAAG